jgi:translation initiation factor IF-2
VLPQGKRVELPSTLGAYSVAYKTQRITFLDTPGHAAFSAMRARGANVTDIVVLIVAADDGLMPQTIEAINHAKAAKVQIMVAITKIDVPGANIDKVKGQLQEKGLAPEDWGWRDDRMSCLSDQEGGHRGAPRKHSARRGSRGAESQREQSARGTVIEAQLEQGRGPTATVIVRTGTLKRAIFHLRKLRRQGEALHGRHGKPLKSAGPSTPVKVLGFRGLPNAGDEFVVMESERAAKALSADRLNDLRMNKLGRRSACRWKLFRQPRCRAAARADDGLKGDVQGSLEALITSLRADRQQKIDSGDVHSARGSNHESDILSRQRRTLSSLGSM